MGNVAILHGLFTTLHTTTAGPSFVMGASTAGTHPLMRRQNTTGEAGCSVKLPSLFLTSSPTAIWCQLTAVLTGQLSSGFPVGSHGQLPVYNLPGFVESPILEVLFLLFLGHRRLQVW